MTCQNHCSYIFNYQKYAKHYKCYECDRSFNQATHLNRHAKVCSTEVEEVYIGGKFKTNDTISERLERVGIKIKEDYFGKANMSANFPDNARVLL